MIIDLKTTKPYYKNNKIYDYCIYFLWFEEELVYIGQTSCLKGRISSHKSDKLFDRVTYTIIKDGYTNVLKIEAENIKHYKPVFNNKTKTLFKRRNFCYFRANGKYQLLWENKLLLIKHHLAYLYNNNILHWIECKKNILYIYEDFDLIDTIEFNKKQTYNFYVVDDVLEVRLM